MNYEKKLTSLKSFWFSSFFFLGIALISSVLIVINTSLDWKFDAEGFNTFLSTLSFPLKFIAGYAAAVGFISLNHKAEQTKRQIELTEENQKFINYFKHRDEFVKHCADYQGTLNPLPASDARKYHEQLFPESRNGDFNFNQHIIENVYSEYLFLLDKIVSYLSALEKEDTTNLMPLHEEITNCYRYQIYALIRFSSSNMTRREYEFKQDSALKDISAYHDVLLSCFDYLKYLISFTDNSNLMVFLDFSGITEQINCNLSQLNKNTNKKRINGHKFEYMRLYNDIFDLVRNAGIIPTAKHVKIPDMLAGKPLTGLKLTKYSF